MTMMMMMIYPLGENLYLICYIHLILLLPDHSNLITYIEPLFLSCHSLHIFIHIYIFLNSTVLSEADKNGGIRLFVFS